MCPLRFILIFLSATLAGIFFLRSFNSHSDTTVTATATAADVDSTSSPKSVEKSPSKICGTFVNGFWTCVDMASGRYLWRHFVSAASKQSD